MAEDVDAPGESCKAVERDVVTAEEEDLSQGGPRDPVTGSPLAPTAVGISKGDTVTLLQFKTWRRRSFLSA